MKRAPFIGAAGAAFLAGCGGSHAMRALPGVAPSTINQGSKGSSGGRLEPQSADAVPEAVLKNPILGEAHRFDGSTAPSGWSFAQGQTLGVQQNTKLFSILGTVGGGDGKTTFKLPAPGFGVIIAIAGTYPTSPLMLQSARRTTLEASLGGLGARPAPVRVAKPPSAQLLAERRLVSSGLRVGAASPRPLTAEMKGRITQATSDARTAALAALSPGNQSRLQSVVEAAVSGRISIARATVEMMSSLSTGEAQALVSANDALIRGFNERWSGDSSQELQREAAAFLISVAITRDQARAMYQRERASER